LILICPDLRVKTDITDWLKIITNSWNGFGIKNISRNMGTGDLMSLMSSTSFLIAVISTLVLPGLNVTTANMNTSCHFLARGGTLAAWASSFAKQNDQPLPVLSSEACHRVWRIPS